MEELDVIKCLANTQQRPGRSSIHCLPKKNHSEVRFDSLQVIGIQTLLLKSNFRVCLP